VVEKAVFPQNSSSVVPENQLHEPLVLVATVLGSTGEQALEALQVASCWLAQADESFCCSALGEELLQLLDAFRAGRPCGTKSSAGRLCGTMETQIGATIQLLWQASGP